MKQSERWRHMKYDLKKYNEEIEESFKKPVQMSVFAWKDGKASLYYFIKLLISSEVIKNPKNKHWQITAEFFLIKNETIHASEMLNQKPTADKRKREKLEN